MLYYSESVKVYQKSNEQLINLHVGPTLTANSSPVEINRRHPLVTSVICTDY